MGNLRRHLEWHLRRVEEELRNYFERMETQYVDPNFLGKYLTDDFPLETKWRASQEKMKEAFSENDHPLKLLILLHLQEKDQ